MQAIKMKKWKTIFKRISLVFLLLIIIAFGRLIIESIRYAPVMFQLLFNKQIDLKTTNNRVNILLLGIGGGSHDGPNLTDTIIFAGIDTASSSARASLISIPRDLWIPEIKGKINTAYAIGEGKRKGAGLILTKAVVGKILNEHIDYALRVDFAGFVKAVDMVGGLEINVERSFDDNEYPIASRETDTCGFKDEEFLKRATAAAQLDAFPCRYEKLHFNKGMQHMNGETALRFVRSRHALGIEGSDFARSKRQEKVINAFKDKIFSLNTLLNPLKLTSLYDIFRDSIDTDIKSSEYDDFIRLAEKMRTGKIISTVLDTGDEATGRAGLLKNPSISENGSDIFGYQWVLIPKAGNGQYTEIQSYASCLLNGKTACVVK